MKFSSFLTKTFMAKAEKEAGKALPELDLLSFGELHYWFMINISPVVFVFETVANLFMLKNKKNTALFLLTATLLILHYEVVISLLPVLLILVFFYIFYSRKEMQRAEVDIAKNFAFI